MIRILFEWKDKWNFCKKDDNRFKSLVWKLEILIILNDHKWSDTMAYECIWTLFIFYNSDLETNKYYK